jgi:hypothetical protein
MPLFAKTIFLHSALPPDALLDRIRGLAEGKLPMPHQSRWRGPVLWSLRELPDAIRLMPLFPPTYRAQQPSFIGTIDPVGSGADVRGRIRPYGLTVWITAFLVFAIGAMSTAGVLQQLSRHSPSKAAQMALIGIGIGAAAVSLLRFSVSFAATPIRQLLETGVASDSQAIDEGAIQPPDAIVPETIERSTRRSFVLRSAAAIDLLTALFLITTPVVSSRVGGSVTLLIAAILASGAGFLWVLANRLSARRE